MDITNIMLKLAEATESDVVYAYGNDHRFNGGSVDDPIIVMSGEMSDKLNKHRALERAAESAGIDLVHYDEYTVDYETGKAWRTQPDSYFWQPAVVWDENGNMLTPDDDIEYWIEWAKNNPSRCITKAMLPDSVLHEAGFEYYPSDDERYENGLHQGMDDDPVKLYESVRASLPESDIIFRLTESSQFYVTFKMMSRPVRSPISSNGFSHDTQVKDALDYLEHNHNGVWEDLVKQFPEALNITWDGSWFDTEAMGVDEEYSSWLCDAIEETGLVEWDEGEPYSVKR